MSIPDDVERIMYRWIYLRLIPFLMLLYFICYVDRVNIGFAKLQFLPQLGMNDAQFGLATALFFVPYALFDIPSNLLLARIGVRKTLLRAMIAWGGLTAAQMFITGPMSLYVIRVLFGAAEAGFISGMWLLLLEGLPAILLGVVAYFYLQDRPASAQWLTPEQKLRLERDMAADRARATGKGGHGFREVLRDPTIYAFALINFACNCGVNAISFGTPSLLRDAGLLNVGTIGWVTGLISLIAAAATSRLDLIPDRGEHGCTASHVPIHEALPCA